MTITISNKVPEEKRSMLRFFGAEVIEIEDELWPQPGAKEGAMARAEKMGE